MTLEEIGETFDLTRERVRQIKEKAIRRLKHTSRSKILKTYLGEPDPSLPGREASAGPFRKLIPREGPVSFLSHLPNILYR